MHLHRNNTKNTIIKLIGAEAANALFINFGGAQLLLPLASRDGNNTFERLAEVIGRTEAHRILDWSLSRSSGNWLYIPKLSLLPEQTRKNAAIANRFYAIQEGISKRQAVQKIALEFGISDGCVRRVIGMVPRASTSSQSRMPKCHAAHKELASDADEYVAAECPESVRDLAQCIGLRATIRLLNMFGGISIAIPKSAETAKNGILRDVRECIGDVLFEKLTKIYGGMPVYLSMLTRHHSKRRNRAIRQRFDKLTATMSAGSSVDTISNDFSLSSRQIWRILKQSD